MEHVTVLAEFFKSLDLDELRVERPQPFIFFCGGIVAKKSKSKSFQSLRDYIYRRPLSLRHRTVLAEDAVKLFQDSEYADLITFEAHIAQISELVLLICESPGSLAELGAFCQRRGIAEHLFVVVPERHSDADSFVRLGPLRILEAQNSDSVGAFPWDDQVSEKGQTHIVIDPQYDSVIVTQIDANLTRPKSEKYKRDNDGHKMILLYWACFMLRAAAKKELIEFFRQIGVAAAPSDIDRYMYCMMVAGWIRKRNIGRQYYIPHYDSDPFHYAYLKADPANPGRADKAKAEIALILKRENLRPPQIQNQIGAGDPVETLE